jgi:eukaryotic-like serine/threonine-protein kinase
LLVRKPDPRVRSALLNAFQPLGVDPQTLVTRLREERDTSARRALLLALSDYKPDDLEPGPRKELVGQLLEAYRDDPDAGIHSAAELVLNSWGHAAELLSVKSALSGRPPASGHRWYLNQDGDTMVVIDPRAASVPLFSPRRPRGVYAISSHEVTVEQFLRFDPGHYVPPSAGPEPDCPISVVRWYQAAAYCNWRSAQEHIPKSEWCYPEEVKSGFTLPRDYLTRTGYRLPTDSEWEYAARAEAVTVRFYGRSLDLLPKYAWCEENSRRRTWPVGRLKPNDYGLFDILGNIQEWCQESNEHLSDQTQGLDVADPLPVTDGRSRAIRSGCYSKEAAATVLDARDTGVPVTEFNSVGFRIMRTMPKPAP